MGRYYNGDIDGKFWFAVQSSDAADRFGVIGDTPNYLVYHFSKEDLESVQKELQNIRENLGNYLTIMDLFFADRNGYTDEQLAEALEVDNDVVKHYLREYADYQLGVKIEAKLIEAGECWFEAEL